MDSGGIVRPHSSTATGLPAAVTISGSGTFSGTPTVSGRFNYKLAVTDSAGNRGTVKCTITVSPGVPICLGETATVGFWHNKNAQALIDGVNGGQNAMNSRHHQRCQWKHMSSKQL